MSMHFINFLVIMLYFKNVDLAEKYHVSEGSVRNWIKEAGAGKLDLDLYENSGRSYVANTSSNLLKIERIVKARKKYRNTKGVKELTPRPEFYTLFSEQHVYDIVTKLEKYHEIPRQYNYFDGGAHHWDVYAQRLVGEESANVINSTLKLLDVNQGYLDGILSRYKRINIIDIGPGNGLPVKNLLSWLLEKKVFGRYIALDISKPMLEVLEKNIHSWFGDAVAFEGYEADINYDRFTQYLAKEYISDQSNETANLILLLGGTLCNERTPDSAFRIIHDSMGVNDYLVHTQKLDSMATRQFFDFSVGPASSEPPPMHRLVLDLLNINKSVYDLELGYDDVRRERYEKIRFNMAVTICFNFNGGKRCVNFNKGDAILIWRSLQQSSHDLLAQFRRNDFYVLHVSQTPDQEYILTVSRST